ncbi:L-threonine dehydratase catabolic TdcB [Monomorium pharaonis]|uniref:L-threonine dehydratase catabolic TdcB n=1 Tax=Monomorium pharaonis TaxID=307658 RepID=UPI00063F1129|nr:L-threonine dehydratase catabolic TdcB [Monomorium pharaonis]XP_036140653.1 L-threonine dehydratase catabolic TdcB [Monomorium pharaonis]
MSSLLQNKGFNIYLKSAYCNENDPNLNSIKTRGVIYSLQQLTAEQKSKGVIAISTGSFAYPLCSFGRRFGIPVTVVMPQDAAEERKVRMCRDLGARVIIKGRNITEAHVSALRTAQAEGLFYLDGNDHPYMIVGQATFGIELDEIRDEKGQMKKFPLDAVILPTNINGCNLTMGLALAIKQWHPNIKIIEICSEQNNSLIQDVRKQTLSTTELKDSPRTFWGHKNIDCLPNCWINLFSTVSEKFVQKAADLLLEKENIIDSYAAIGLAAILNGQLDDLKGKNVLIPLFGRMDSFMDLTNKPGSSREVN